ncbi:hypothetical protein KIN20_036573 [Parelaphostrongylus tenuis]|uniref:Uncharacterized protein n=1 Tax=Parelaphostrongylus tenuis TaxID=148309 RepID=A0AAD5RCR4_PARTN|nr:hypothetical protein KIN20_036573 [Parelaphostrongylus tenuis]
MKLYVIVVVNDRRLLKVLFAAFTLALGIVETNVNGEHLRGYLLLCVSFMLFCLFIEFYLGVTYNCWSLLICHAAQASGLGLSLFVLMICTMLFTFPDQITVLSFKLTTRIVFLTIVIAMTLMGNFAVSSFHRARELGTPLFRFISHGVRASLTLRKVSLLI